jgi:hypothetical protein
MYQLLSIGQKTRTFFPIIQFAQNLSSENKMKLENEDYIDVSCRNALQPKQAAADCFYEFAFFHGRGEQRQLEHSLNTPW